MFTDTEIAILKPFIEGKLERLRKGMIRDIHKLNNEDFDKVCSDIKYCATLLKALAPHPTSRND